MITDHWHLIIWTKSDISGQETEWVYSTPVDSHGGNIKQATDDW